MPMGQVNGVHAMSSTVSMSSSSSMGGRPSRSSLLMKLMIGVARRRQIPVAYRSLTGDDPLAQSLDSTPVESGS